ncbi:uncharacterized protein LOC144486806 isoform X2 [Mustelus asterias]
MSGEQDWEQRRQTEDRLETSSRYWPRFFSLRSLLLWFPSPCFTGTTISSRLSTANWSTSTTDYRQTTSNWKKGTTDYRPTTANWKKGTTDYRPTTANWKMGTTDYRPTTANWKKGTTDYRPTTANWKTGTTDYRPTTANWKKGTTDYRPTTANWKTGTTDYRPTTANWKTGTTDYRQTTANWNTIAAVKARAAASSGPVNHRTPSLMMASTLAPGTGQNYFSTELSDWHGANNSCVANYSTLAIVTSQSQQNFIENHDSEKRWIGLTDLDQVGDYVWVNGERLGKGFWARREPNNPDEERCVTKGAQFEPGKWNDDVCSVRHRWICQTSSSEYLARRFGLEALLRQ